MVDLIQTILNSAVEMLIKFKDKKQIFPPQKSKDTQYLFIPVPVTC